MNTSVGVFKRVANFIHFSAFSVKMYLKLKKKVYIIVVLMDMSNVYELDVACML